MNLLGIDHGGTATKLLLVADDTVVERATLDTGSMTDLDALAAGVRAFLAGRTVDRFGLTVAGTLDPVTQVVLSSANLRWLDGLAPAALLAERLGVPGTVVQDGAAAASAEAALGAGRGADDVFVLALGTGIAGAHVLAGEPRAGAAGGAGEIGHLVVLPDGPRCGCGQRGCLETAIGGVQLGLRWREAGGGWSGAGAPTARDVVAAAGRGDPTAVSTLAAGTDALARALLHLLALVDPGLLVVGGGVASAPRWTVEPALERLRALATFHRVPEVRLAELGSWAGAHGAVLAAAR